MSKSMQKLFSSVKAYGEPLPLFPKEMDAAYALEAQGLICVFQRGAHGMFAKLA